MPKAQSLWRKKVLRRLLRAWLQNTMPTIKGGFPMNARCSFGSSRRRQRGYGQVRGGRRRRVHQPAQQLLLLRPLLLLLLLVTSFDDYTQPVAAAHNDDHHGIAPTLPLSDINVVIVTDVHSWVGGHILPLSRDDNNDGPEPRRTADYGDVLSFVEHLKNYVYYSSSSSSSSSSFQSSSDSAAAATPEERDVWLVMNGDWIDGTGLAMNGDGTHLIPILEKMNFDAVTVGNHELYSNTVIAQMLQPAGLIEFLGHRYVSSNVMRAERTDRSIGNLYTLLRGRHANLLVFGFLYEMTDAGNLVTVQQVSAVVQAPWFQAVVKATTEYHAILVLAHMDVHDPLLQIILTAIRKLTGPDMPVQFVTGHTHYRGATVLDDYSTSVEAGRYLDTVGFVSFPSTKQQQRRRRAFSNAEEEEEEETVRSNVTSAIMAPIPDDAASSLPAVVTAAATTTAPSPMPAAAAPPVPPPVTAAVHKFQHVFIDATPAALKEALGMAADFELKTMNGEDLSRFIQQIQLDLGLNKVVGWTCETYYLNRSITAQDSIWGLFQRQVVPTQATARNQVVLLESGSWRYDVLYQGDVRLDDVIGVSPFNSSFVVLNNVEMKALLDFNETVNAVENTFMKVLPNYVLSFADPNATFDTVNIYVDSFEAKSIVEALNRFSSVPIDPPIATNLTTTSIWLDYFAKEGYDYCKTQHGLAPPKSHFNKKNGESTGGTEDLFEATFGAVAIATVLVLCAAMVRQQGALTQQESAAKEFVVFQAQQEYDQSSYHDDADLSDPEYGAEGEFL